MTAQSTLDTCAAYKRAIASGEHPTDIVGELAQQYGVLRPAIWKRLSKGGARPPYGTRAPLGPRPRDTRESRITVLPEAVDRDPCQRCGVRHDIGCKHSHAPLGMVF